MTVVRMGPCTWTLVITVSMLQKAKEERCMPCRGRSRGLSIEVLRRAMQDGTLEAALQRDTPVPSDRKRCKLCGEIKDLDNFRELPRGGHESYCRPCNKYVRRGIKRGLHIEAVRQAFMVRCGAFPGSTSSCTHLHPADEYICTHGYRHELF